MPSRIKDIAAHTSGFSPEYVFLIDKVDTGSGDSLQSRTFTLGEVGNTYIQGSTNGINWHDEVTASDTYLRIITDGGTTWINFTTVPSR